jgi:orotidine-5'-phosphate decarboxylase
MESFNHRLVSAICYAASHVCVGLDPDAAKVQSRVFTTAAKIAKNANIPGAIADAGDTASASIRNVSLCQAVATLTREFAAAFKPNAAFFEGERTGLAALEGIRRFLGDASPHAITICDAKRGDIGNTSGKYAEAVFDRWGYDAVTVNPLMGTDAVQPFLRDPSRGAFLLCLTSNPGAADFLLKNELYKRIAEQAVKWNTNSNVGLVVGATRAEHAAAIREIAPDLPLLIPGVGAQGGSLDEILDAIQAKNNPAFLINASRSIMLPPGYEDADWATAVTAAARELRDSINARISRARQPSTAQSQNSGMK